MLEGIPKNESIQPKAIFLKALENELTKSIAEGRLTEEQATNKRKNAWKIETGFSDDPSHDAKLFVSAGIASEEELIKLLNKN